jgi:hypothetical protein
MPRAVFSARLLRKEVMCQRWADRRDGVELFEAQALGGKAVDVGGCGLLVSEAGKIAPTHVIDENHDDVGTARSSGRVGRDGKV